MPGIYQRVGDRREEIDGRFVLRNQSDVAFELGPYDLDRPLTIDPVLSYSTFLGGSPSASPTGRLEVGADIALDAAGNIYVAGTEAFP